MSGSAALLVIRQLFATFSAATTALAATFSTTFAFAPAFAFTFASATHAFSRSSTCTSCSSFCTRTFAHGFLPPHLSLAATSWRSPSTCCTRTVTGRLPLRLLRGGKRKSAGRDKNCKYFFHGWLRLNWLVNIVRISIEVSRHRFFGALGSILLTTPRHLVSEAFRNTTNDATALAPEIATE